MIGLDSVGVVDRLILLIFGGQLQQSSEMFRVVTRILPSTPDQFGQLFKPTQQHCSVQGVHAPIQARFYTGFAVDRAVIAQHHQTFVQILVVAKNAAGFA